jgi:FKBP-type peptidyl-prolyl cis-trans isomerase 2
MADKVKPEKISIKPIYLVLIIVIAAAIIASVAYVSLAHYSSTLVVASGDNVSVYYNGTLTNGTVFDSNFGKTPFQFTVGANEVIPGFDQGVIGMKLNQTKTITIPPNQAYGEINPSLIVKIPLTEFGNQTITTGQVITQTSNGQQFYGLVTSVNKTTAVVNFNPKLAGQTLIFKIEVIAIHKK